MELTPIHIRGKKRKHNKSSLTSKLQVLDSATSSDSNATSKSKRRKLRKKKGAAPAMPTLQGLPQELLEIIFLYSGNIHLPQCSPTLGRRLSSPAVTMEFTMRSFFHTVDHKTNYRDRKKTSDPTLQSALLSCRFFTWNFFLAYVQRAQKTMIRQRGKAWGEQIPGVAAFDGLWPFVFTKITYLAFAEGFQVPEKLLHGPWTKDKASLLYVLVSLYGEISWSGSMSGEIAKGGMRDAIKEGNEHAVAALSVLLGIPKMITTDILRFAVVQCGCNINIMRHLLFNAQILALSTHKDTLNFLDPQLWTWADQHPDKGVVLKDMLRKADAFNLEFFFEEDVDWRTVIPFPYGGSKFDARTAFSGMVREFLANLYSNHGRKITRQRRNRDTHARQSQDETWLNGIEETNQINEELV